MVGDLNFATAMRNTFLLVIIVVPMQVVLALAMAHDAAEDGARPRPRAVDLDHPARRLRPRGRASSGSRSCRTPAISTPRSTRSGSIDGPRSWLNAEAPVTLFLGIVAAEVWRATAIVLVILVAGLQLIPKEYGEAAEVFGASRGRNSARSRCRC